MTQPAHARKPDTRAAMQALISQAREKLPFTLPEAQLCDGICNGCSKKLLDYADAELDDWQARIDTGEVPRLGDLEKLGRTLRKIYRVIERNVLLPQGSTAAGNSNKGESG
ncbi:hypothetical protein [Marinobacterium lutimaris]|uniref:Uncharacterized protein n=1 Tax=Marinobacterium lutimaris TaxID=568106 RepID=A0A1H5TNY5_9GAMM|nr:hypothetical protein [Marinobacterium lutimaris]SEF64494.1 hypothetical protein SAMN05444390_101130 [Marinobacterium lutimaris]